MKKTLLTLLSGFVLIGTLSGCTENSTKQNGKQIVKIGMIAPLSGPGSTYGEDQTYPLKATIDKYNNTLSNKYHIDLIIEDGKCSAKDASSAAQKLINVDKVTVIIGGACSSETIGAGKIAQENKVVIISPTAVSSEISTLGDYVFRFVTNKEIAKQIAEYMKGKFDNIVLIVENKDATIDVKNNFVSLWTGKISEYKYDADEKDFNVLAKQIDMDGVDALVTFVQSESTSIPLYKALFNQGIIEKVHNNVFGHPALLLPQFIEAFSGRVEGFKQGNVATSSAFGSKASDYISSLQGKYQIKSVEYITLFSKETTEILIDAINSGHIDSQSIKKYLESINENNPRNGIIGKYYFDINGDVVGIPYVMESINNDQRVVID